VPGCDSELQDLVLAELDDYQPTAIQESSDSKDNQRLRAFFATADARDRAAQALGAAFGSHLFIEPADVDDEDWAARSQAALRAVTVGRITVAPPWEKKRGRESFSPAGSEKDPRPLFLVIQPSMGFGTGHHATTRLMLSALQLLDVQDRHVLDIGCGSGVLAIAAALLGARSALGVDNDPDALTSAAENLELNAVADRVRLANEDMRDLTSPADIVLANLTGDLLEHSAETLAALVAPGGDLIVSGIMQSESTVLPALENFLGLERVDKEEEWICATFRRSSIVDRRRPKNPSTRTVVPRQQARRQHRPSAPVGPA
jgi:ribosomal protein L11 methyltransferase